MNIGDFFKIVGYPVVYSMDRVSGFKVCMVRPVGRGNGGMGDGSKGGTEGRGRMAGEEIGRTVRQPPETGTAGCTASFWCDIQGYGGLRSVCMTVRDTCGV